MSACSLALMRSHVSRNPSISSGVGSLPVSQQNNSASVSDGLGDSSGVCSGAVTTSPLPAAGDDVANAKPGAANGPHGVGWGPSRSRSRGGARKRRGRCAEGVVALDVSRTADGRDRRG
jgi:hypothetical protein